MKYGVPGIAVERYRTGTGGCGGCGTNRVIEERKRYGFAPPEFEDRAGGLVATFRAAIIPGAGRGHRVEADSGAESLEGRILILLRQGPRSAAEVSGALGNSTPSGAMKRVLRGRLEEGLIERTIPTKPNSRLQKYRLTDAGRNAITGEAR